MTSSETEILLQKLASLEGREKLMALLNLGRARKGVATELQIQYLTEAIRISSEMNFVDAQIQANRDLGILMTEQKHDPVQAEKYFLTAYKLLDQTSNQELQATTLNVLGISYGSSGKYQEAYEVFKQSLAKFEAVDSKRQIAALYGNLGVTCCFLGRLDEALDYQLKSLQLARDENNQLTIANSYKNIGNIYSQLEEFDKGFEHYESALYLYREIGNEMEIARIQNNISLMHAARENNDEALRTVQESMSIARRLGAKTFIAQFANNMGVIYRNLERNGEALNCFQEAKELSHEVNFRSLYAQTLGNLGEINYIIGDFETAIEYYLKCEAAALEIGDQHLQMRNAKLQAELFAKRGDFNQAYQYQIKYTNHKDEILSQENLKKINELKTRYESERKEQEAEIHKLKNIELVETNQKLEEALKRVKVLSGLVPICSSCKKIRDDQGFWNQLEIYISQHSDATFTHGLCPDCLRQIYPEYDLAQKIVQ